MKKTGRKTNEEYYHNHLLCEIVLNNHSVSLVLEMFNVPHQTPYYWYNKVMYNIHPETWDGKRYTKYGNLMKEIEEIIYSFISFDPFF